MLSTFPPLVISFIILWFVLLSLFFIFFCVFYFFIKKYGHSFWSLMLSLFVGFAVQVLVAYIKGGNDDLCNFFASIPLYVYIIVLSAITLVIPIFGTHLHTYSKNHISANSIIKGFDASTEGFLYFDEDGACLFINKKMEKIASLLIKNYILNGHDFLKLVKDKTITLSDGSTYKFVSKDIAVDGEFSFLTRKKTQIVTELLALDITELVKKNELLEEDNRKLKELNKELEAYNNKTLEVVRHKEILSAKINIHNEMNALVLQSSYLLNNGTKEEKDKILSKWENNSLLLFKEAKSEDNTDFIDDLNTLAKAIGITIECNDYSLVKDDEKITSLFVKATKESLLNIAKHTKNKKIIINIGRKNNHIVMSFINDNNQNTKPIIMGGGLSNLERQVKELKGKMVIINNEDIFELRIEV